MVYGYGRTNGDGTLSSIGGIVRIEKFSLCCVMFPPLILFQSPFAMRYLDQEFTEVQVTKDVEYGRAINFETQQFDAMQDTKAAIRWFRANAQNFRFDPGRIATGGSSAGGVNAMNSAYCEDEGQSGNSGFSSQVQAIVECSGLCFTDSIDNGETPLMMFHGTDDQTIPYALALTIQSRADAVGIPNQLIAVQGGGHPSTSYMLMNINIALSFLYQYMIQQVSADFASPVAMDQKKSVEIFPNPFQYSVHLRSSGARTNIGIYNLQGVLV